MATKTAASLTDADLFLRLWERQKLTPTLARHLLKLDWSAEDESRMQELSAKNRGGQLDELEGRELETYVRVGLLLSVLQSRARKLLKPTKPGSVRG
ncbi:hypothetical protein [Limnoglobus roseus]|uniref:Uncharacterized protein n=1 Tax=Limnoglobus roseus TaxID=2598579 RepID=A0A5C1A376_9BACT|nr:hypothetical protein [Limnoglobus roseus]QEL13559.1 hypothetical protein PX52LOC_00417 [Limnoglobus roseus]